MANFLPLYAFISIIPIIFLLVAWYSIRGSREPAWNRASLSAARLREYLKLLFHPLPWSGTRRRAIDKDRAEAEDTRVGAALEIQDFHTAKHKIQGAAGLSHVLGAVTSKPATADSEVNSRASHHGRVTAAPQGAATEESSTSGPSAQSMPAPPVASISDAHVASTIRGPCSSPQTPACRSWWELHDDDDGDEDADKEDGMEMAPSFKRKTTVPGRSSAFRPRAW